MKDDKNASNKKIFIKRFLISSICIFLGFFIFLFIYDYGYLFEKEERGHLASIFYNLNKFEIDISEENNCEILWNKTPIYKNGEFLSKNINLERYVYGDNYFKVSINNNSKYYYLFKPNNWEYHNFKFSISNEKINFWIDEKIQEEDTYISEYYK